MHSYRTQYRLPARGSTPHGLAALGLAVLGCAALGCAALGLAVLGCAALGFLTLLPISPYLPHVLISWKSAIKFFCLFTLDYFSWKTAIIIHGSGALS